MNANQLYKKAFSAFGPQDWWPAETPWEVVVGAILTQQTSWKNVEKAIANLKAKGLVGNDPLKLANAPLKTIQARVKCTGFYRQKAGRLKKTAAHFAKNYARIGDFFKKPVAEARKELRSLDGIGPETADSILLYAAGKPVFVIDAYTHRVCERALGKKFKCYSDAQTFFEKAVPPDAEKYKEFHALIVELAKRHCKTRPICGGCPLEKGCAQFKASKKRGN